MKSILTNAQATLDNANGRVGMPILMYIMGVPGFVCVLAWLFFFRGH